MSTVFRVEKSGNYTVMSNHHFKERDMSLKAKGLLSLMLSLPDSWDYSVEGLISLSTDGETSVRSGLKELKDLGYLQINKIYPDKSTTGRIQYEYIIYEHPITNKQEVGNLVLEDQVLEDQVLEDRPQLNTNKLNTNKLNTNTKNSVDRRSTSSDTSSSKLFSTKTNLAKLTKKQESWINHKLDILDEYDFTDKVKDEMYKFFISLAQTNSLLADMTIRMQLTKLSEVVKTEAQQVQVIRDTISRGWKSLDYMVNDITNLRNKGFDTAKNSQNQLYTEEEKERLRHQMANASEEDVF